MDAQHFVDYYSATGWKCGDKPMQDWKAMVRLWERRAKAENIPTPPEESYGCTIQR